MESPQGVGQEIFYCLGSAVVAAPDAARIAERSEFHRNHHLRARYAFQRAADQHLVVTHAIEVAGVDESDTRIDRGTDRRDGLGLVGWTVNPGRHAHAAEPNLGYRDAGRTECAFGDAFAIGHG